MSNPTMLYKHPGPHEIHGDKFDYQIVDSENEQEFEAALADGWCLTTDEAKGSELSTEAEAEAEAEAVESADTDGNGYLKKDEIMAKLDELGVEYKKRDSRDTLLALLEDALNA